MISNKDTAPVKNIFMGAKSSCAENSFKRIDTKW